MNRFLLLVIIFVSVLLSEKGFAQLVPMGSMYFQNQYLGNPAMAGMRKGINLNISSRQELVTLPGSPVSQIMTAEYAFTEKAGLGVSVLNDQDGLFKRTRGLLSYAYHIPLNGSGAFDYGEGEHLSFGLSASIMDERFEQDLDSDPDDISVIAFNDRAAYVDGDFGIAYHSNGLNIQAALPKLRSILSKNLIYKGVDRSTYFASASYKTELVTDIDIEPKIVYRGVAGFDDIIDAGANISYSSYSGYNINLFGMYNSSKSATMGFGFGTESLSISGMYSPSFSTLEKYIGGGFEIGLRINLLNK